ncbi:MAG: prepilin-type N-terminal cleavage/methylation domain-containing protein [Candidatus Moraniibacteriota bacterium]
MKNLEKKNNQKEAGFTLIEIILVMFMVSVVFVAIYSLFSKNIKEYRESNMEVVASNLAQEGVEIVRNARDNNWLAGGSMTDGLSSGSCIPSISSSGIPSCGSGSDTIKIVDDSGVNIYQNGGSGTETEFRRECGLNPFNDEEIEVTCTVEWDSFVNPDLDREVKATGYLTNWQEY